MGMTTSQSAIDLIKNYEKPHLKAYDLGDGGLTIGYGHFNDPKITSDTVITQQQAEAYLRSDLAKFEAHVSKAVSVSLTQNQFDALVIFAFNTGAKVTDSVFREINAGNFEKAMIELAGWRSATIRGKKQIQDGLIARRNDEIELFMGGDANRDYHYKDYYAEQDAIKYFIKDAVKKGLTEGWLDIKDIISLGNNISDEFFNHIFGSKCFPAGTMINMWGGSEKDIKDIQPFDEVVTHDEAGNRVKGIVDKTFTNTTSELIRLTFDDGRDDLYTTPGHNFMSETGDYMPIGHLVQLSGAYRDGRVRLVDSNGEIATASAELLVYSSKTEHLFASASARTTAYCDGNTVRQFQAPEGWQTHNFEVRKTHTYVSEGVRVHNKSSFIVQTGHDYQNNSLVELLESLGILDEHGTEITIIKQDRASRGCP